MKKILYLLVCFMCLSGCSKANLVCYNKAGNFNIPGSFIDSEGEIGIPFQETISFKENDGMVSNYTDKITYNTTNLLNQEAQKKFKEAIETSFDEDYKKEGIILETSLKDNALIFILKIDFLKVDKSSDVLLSLGFDSTYFNKDGYYPFEFIDELMIKNEYTKEK